MSNKIGDNDKTIQILENRVISDTQYNFYYLDYLYAMSKLYKLEYNNNTLIRYFNIKKRLAKNSSFIRIKNRCVVSGRSHAIHRLFKLSRIKLRELTMAGSLPGVVKSSW